jgi:hypothetical protein
MTNMEPPHTLDQVFALDPEQFDKHWSEIDAIVQAEPVAKQAEAWERIAVLVGDSHSKGMPFFRLGIVNLITNTDETKGVGFLESAFKEDEKFGPSTGQLPHRMGAYRLLSLTKEYFEYLRRRKSWEKDLLLPENRQVLITTLLIVYDRSLVDALLMHSYNYRAFFTLLSEHDLCAFAIENYYCAESLIHMYFTEGQTIDRARDEYPLARSIVALLGGVLEAFLVERLPDMKNPTLGGLLGEAHTRGVMHVGTKLSALSSLMLHLRNYLHADLQRTDYLIDINTAKGCKAALDWVIAELLEGSSAK